MLSARVALVSVERKENCWPYLKRMEKSHDQLELHLACCHLWLLLMTCMSKQAPNINIFKDPRWSIFTMAFICLLVVESEDKLCHPHLMVTPALSDVPSEHVAICVGSSCKRRSRRTTNSMSLSTNLICNRLEAAAPII
ncbi:hypothetical protein C1H46_006582 [Malus baccata]|uniref:Uncharacterized protein n=1 Tax=Malus baccata TaxID=106549 RepID=A0A540NB58_MALBA|nr:hypothetical protein C1H46_006582 [Malus baccata]